MYLAASCYGSDDDESLSTNDVVVVDSVPQIKERNGRTVAASQFVFCCRCFVVMTDELRLRFDGDSTY